MTTIVIAFSVGLLVGLLVGYKLGKRAIIRALKSLKIPPKGARISYVGYERKK